MKDKKTQYVITRVYTGEKSIEDVFENIMKYTIKENLYKEKMKI